MGYIQKKSLKRVKVAYNNVFRKLFGFKRDASMTLEMTLLGINHFNVLHRNSINSLRDRLSNSSNSIVTNFLNMDWFLQSNMYKHWCNILC